MTDTKSLNNIIQKNTKLEKKIKELCVLKNPTHILENT